MNAQPAFLSGLQHVARTDIGMRRANNQDSHAVVLAEDEQAWRERGHAFMVADGMGAHAAGELASKLAVDNIRHLYYHYRELAPAEALEKAIVDANAEIHRRGQANPDFHAMGTTASVLVLLPQIALVGHVGDSRVYRLRGNQLEQLTFDHSLQWELRSLGRLSPDSELAKSIPKNVITRSLGPNPQVAVDLEGPLPLEPGDTFLLCSDGLSGQVKDHEIGNLLAHLPPKEAATVLVDLANIRGGPDNVTVVIAKVGPEAVEGGSNRPGFATRKYSRQNAGVLASWIVTAVCFLVAMILWPAGQTAAAAVFALSGLAAIVVGGVLQWRSRPSAESPPKNGYAYGQAPYASVTCAADKDFAATLASILTELREAAVEANWKVYWAKFDDLERGAKAASKDGDYSAAIGSYARAISFMMSELRQQQNRKATNSSSEHQ
jgi:protein phosphatase